MARSRADLEKIVARGETVLHRGTARTSVAELPSAVELAGRNPVKRQFALGEVKDKAAKLRAELAQAEAEERQLQEPPPPDEAPQNAEEASEAPSVEGEAPQNAEELVSGSRRGRKF